MSRTIVSIISEQTIPNYIFIKEMFREGDDLMFITSCNDTILLKAKYIEKSLNLPYAPKYISLAKPGDEENWQAMKDLIEPELSKDKEYIVNLTGGTKYMAITVEMVFANYNASFYYIPFPKNNILQLKNDSIKRIDYRIRVVEYMGLYGLPISTHQVTQSKEYAEEFFNIFNDNLFSEREYEILDKLRAYRNSKRINIETIETKLDEERRPQISGLSKFLEFINFPQKTEGVLEGSEICYITGGWFEEYVYYLIKEKLNPTDIQIGVLIKPSETTNLNDLDVVFSLGNKLFVIECKTGVGKEGLFNQIVYKASALKETLLGLSGQSYIFSLSGEVERLRVIAKNMGVVYCDRTYFFDKEKMDMLFERIRKYADE